MTPKQESINKIIKRFGKHGITAEEIGTILGQPKKKAEKWAKPAIKELIKRKLVYRDREKFYPKICESNIKEESQRRTDGRY